jgi:hypothetical protein
VVDVRDNAKIPDVFRHEVSRKLAEGLCFSQAEWDRFDAARIRLCSRLLKRFAVPVSVPTHGQLGAFQVRAAEIE